MPELPEVETLRGRLAPVLVGRRLVSVEVRDPRLTSPRDPGSVAEELTGERVTAVDRRGKYLVVRFESRRVLVAHLRMTGGFRHSARGDREDGPHVRAVVRLDDGSDIVYRDVRRFGTWIVLSGDEASGYLDQRLGEEPLTRRFTAAELTSRLTRRRAPVKAAILDQRVVAGLGNIYADEALWYARVHPLRPAASLSAGETRRLHRGIRRALALGIERQGSTLRDYALPDGSAGAMQREFRAYGRGGDPCDRCGTPLVSTRVAGRGTAFCPRCQPPGRGPAGARAPRPGSRATAGARGRSAP